MEAFRRGRSGSSRELAERRTSPCLRRVHVRGHLREIRMNPCIFQLALEPVLGVSEDLSGEIVDVGNVLLRLVGSVEIPLL